MLLHLPGGFPNLWSKRIASCCASNPGVAGITADVIHSRLNIWSLEILLSYLLQWFSSLVNTDAFWVILKVLLLKCRSHFSRVIYPHAYWKESSRESISDPSITLLSLLNQNLLLLYKLIHKFICLLIT